MPGRQNSYPVNEQQRGNFWQKIIGVTNIVLALCAGYGIWISLQSSKQTSQALLQASNAFETYSFPVVKYSHYRWVVVNQDTRNCENPAIGIEVFFKNFSSSPVIIEKRDLKFFMGEKPVLENPEVITGIKGEIIFTPDEINLIGRASEKEFPEYYKRMKGYSPPYLNFKLFITYKSVATGKRYQYTGEFFFYENCENPEQRTSALEKDKIEELQTRTDSTD